MSLIRKPYELTIQPKIKMLIYGQAGIGKAQPLFCGVLTPNGYKAMGDIQVGDTVLSVDGKTQKVEGVYPQGLRPVFKIATNDGAITFCDIDHIWTVRNSTGNSRKAGWRSMTLRQMIDKGIMCPLSPSAALRNRKPSPRFEIPVSSAVSYTTQDLPIDPYILGVLIGDGFLVGRVAMFSNPDTDSSIKDEVNRRLPDDFYLTKHDGTCPQYCIVMKEQVKGRSFLKKIDNLGLCVHSSDKFIPDMYLHADIQQRLDLLRGLMDTDGTAHNNRISYSTTSEKLAQDMVVLVRSLGGIAKIHFYEREDEDKAEYRVSIRINNCPFLLKRKAEQWSESTISRYIVSAEYTGEFQTQCIKVSNPDELYITDGFIVTHNTTLALSAPSPLLFDFDGGINRVNYAFTKDTVQINSYQECLDVLNKEDLSPYETIVIDTGGKCLDKMAEYIIHNNPKMGKANGSLTLQGYGTRKIEFSALCKLIASKGKHVLFVAHRQTEKEGDDYRYVPLFGGSNYDSLVTDLDLVGYMEANGRKRTITFDPTSRNDGKNTCNMPDVMEVPTIVDEKGNPIGENDFITKKVIEPYINRLKERQKIGEEYQRLIEEIKEQIEVITDAASANDFISRIDKFNHIGSSKAMAARLLKQKADSLHLIFNKAEKIYEQPAA